MLLADVKDERMDIWKKMVRELSSMEDFTRRLFTVGKADAWHAIPQTAFSMLSLCLIHVDYPDGLLLGKKVYEASPFCRVIYFGTGVRNVAGFLPSRPVGYLDLKQGKSGMWNCLNEAYQSIRRDQHHFQYEDRYQNITHPVSAVMYFSSRDRKVYFQTPLGERGPLRRTLDQIAQMLPSGDYLRCHKSYLVRRDLCTNIDKATSELVLYDGTRIPVSRAYWKEISGMFCKNAVFTGEKYELADSGD